MIHIGIIAEGIMMELPDGTIIEMGKETAVEIASRLIEAVAYIEAGVTTKDSFTEFLEAFKS